MKKTEFGAYNTPLRADGIIAIKMRDETSSWECATPRVTTTFCFVSRKGQAIRFAERDVRSMGRDTSGVRGMRLRQGDEVIAAAIAEAGADLLVVTKNGYGKRTRVEDYPRKGRGGLGVKTVQLTEAKGQLAGARMVREGMHVMMISTGGTVIRMAAKEIKRLGRSTQGVIVMRLRGDEQVSTLALVAEGEPNGEEGEVLATVSVDGGVDSTNGAVPGELDADFSRA